MPAQQPANSTSRARRHCRSNAAAPRRLPNAATATNTATVLNGTATALTTASRRSTPRA